MYLAGPFIQAEQTNIAIRAFNVNVGDITGATKHLYTAVCNASAHFRGKVLADRRVHRYIDSLVTFAGRLEHQRFCGLNLRLTIGDHGLDKLEVHQLVSELTTFGHETNGFIEHADRRPYAQGGKMDPLLIEYLHGCSETHAFLSANKIGNGYTTVLEVNFRHW